MFHDQSLHLLLYNNNTLLLHLLCLHYIQRYLAMCIFGHFEGMDVLLFLY